VEELIRNQIHDALEVEATPPYLRARVMRSLPAADRHAWRPPSSSIRLAGQWAAGLVAMLLAGAIIAGLLYSRGLLRPPVPAIPEPAPPVGLVSPEGVAIGSDGTVYLSDFLGDRVFKVRPDGGVVVMAGGGASGDGPATMASLNHPAGLAIDGSGSVYIADTSGGTIRRVDTSGIISTLEIRDANGVAAQLRLTGVPTGLAFDPSGRLWVSEFYGTIRSIDASGATTVLDSSALPPPALVPGYIAFDSAGNLYISDRASGASNNPLYQNPVGGGCRIVRVSPDKNLSVIAGTGVCGFSGDGGPAASAELNDPNGIAFDSVGNLYFADANNHRIRRIDKNGIITTVAGTGVGGYTGDGGPASQAQLEYPFGIGITPTGLLYFADATCSCWAPAVPGHLRVIKLSDRSIATVMSSQTPIQTSQ
jgi:sugar lactone lactonase YvrE